jgi:hypothetical protein
MPFEIPREVNVYDLIALAVIEQAVTDARAGDRRLAAEARAWLEREGKAWWDALRLGEEAFNRLVKNALAGA